MQICISPQSQTEVTSKNLLNLWQLDQVVVCVRTQGFRKWTNEDSQHLRTCTFKLSLMTSISSTRSLSEQNDIKRKPGFTQQWRSQEGRGLFHSVAEASAGVGPSLASGPGLLLINLRVRKPPQSQTPPDLPSLLQQRGSFQTGAVGGKTAQSIRKHYI